MSCKNTPTSYFNKILNNINPRSRVLSELHTQQPIDSVYLQLINGDTQISKQMIPFHQHHGNGSGGVGVGGKNSFNDMLRLKMLSQAKSQRDKLEHKLGYLNNSINALYKFEEVNGRRSASFGGRGRDVGLNMSGREEWREGIEERAKEIARKKKIAQEIKSKKEQQLKQVQQRMKQQQIAQKKKQHEQSLKQISQRQKKRNQQQKQSEQRYSQLLKQKSLHTRLSENYTQQQLSFLEQRKKKLAQIRNLHRPLDELQLKEHEQRFLQNKRQKQQLRERQKRMNQSRSHSYQPFYKSMFYQKVVEEKGEDNVEQSKMEKIRQYAEKVKEQFVPGIDQNKKQQIQEFIQKQRRKKQQKQQKQLQLRQKAKQKGIQYLQLVKNLPKKPRKSSLTTPPPQPQPYPNYLTHTSLQKRPTQHKFSRILSSTGNKQQKALQLQYESQKYEEELKRKQQQVRLLKKGNDQDVDDGYFSIIKAKLELLGGAG